LEKEDKALVHFVLVPNLRNGHQVVAAVLVRFPGVHLVAAQPFVDEVVPDDDVAPCACFMND